MLSAFQLGPDVFRLRAVETSDSDGDPVVSWATPDRRKLYRATVYNRATEETPVPSSARLHDEATISIPGRVDLTAGDRVEIAGDVFDVVGDPLVAVGLSIGVETRAELSRVRGS